LDDRGSPRFTRFHARLARPLRYRALPMRKPQKLHGAPRREARWPTRAARIALAAAAVLFALVGAAVLAGPQIIVSRGLLTRWVNHDPDKFLLEYDSASAWPPGQVHMRGLRIRAQDPNVQYFFRMDDARVSVSFLDLLSRRFHATRVRASGLVF